MPPLTAGRAHGCRLTTGTAKALGAGGSRGRRLRCPSFSACRSLVPRAGRRLRPDQQGPSYLDRPAARGRLQRQPDDLRPAPPAPQWGLIRRIPHPTYVLTRRAAHRDLRRQALQSPVWAPIRSSSVGLAITQIGHSARRCHQAGVLVLTCRRGSRLTGRKAREPRSAGLPGLGSVAAGTVCRRNLAFACVG
jgi:hypothetical protein